MESAVAQFLDKELCASGFKPAQRQAVSVRGPSRLEQLEDASLRSHNTEILVSSYDSDANHSQ